MMDVDLGSRIDEAERVADRPWQFCFILGGGWRRSKQAVDAARCKGADLILAAVAMLQLVSRDAHATPSKIKEICLSAGIMGENLDEGLVWLDAQRLILGLSDCRTPHQRFAAVSPRTHHLRDRVMVDDCRSVGWSMVCSVILNFRLREYGLYCTNSGFGGDRHRWKRFINQDAVRTLVSRCWETENEQRDYAAMTISELWDFAEGGATAIVEPHTTRLAEWISNPTDCAHGLGYLLNNLSQRDCQTARTALSASDSAAVAAAFSAATVDTASGLAKLMSSIGSVGLESWSNKLRSGSRSRFAACICCERRACV